MWGQLAEALCLVFVIEGIMPFVAPKRWRLAVSQIASFDDRTLRLIGLASMLAGAITLMLLK